MTLVDFALFEGNSLNPSNDYIDARSKLSHKLTLATLVYSLWHEVINSPAHCKYIGQIDPGEAGAAESKSRWRKWQKNFWSGILAFNSTLKEQYFIDSESKGEVISSKIDRLATIYTSKFKWAW